MGVYSTDFRFPRKIIYMGRFLTAIRIIKKGEQIICLYEDDELGVQTSFMANEFKFHEHYGNIERRATWTEQSN